MRQEAYQSLAIPTVSVRWLNGTTLVGSLTIVNESSLCQSLTEAELNYVIVDIFLVSFPVRIWNPDDVTLPKGWLRIPIGSETSRRMSVDRPVSHNILYGSVVD